VFTGLSRYSTALRLRLATPLLLMRLFVSQRPRGCATLTRQVVGTRVEANARPVFSWAPSIRLLVTGTCTYIAIAKGGFITHDEKPSDDGPSFSVFELPPAPFRTQEQTHRRERINVRPTPDPRTAMPTTKSGEEERGENNKRSSPDRRR